MDMEQYLHNEKKENKQGSPQHQKTPYVGIILLKFPVFIAFVP